MERRRAKDDVVLVNGPMLYGAGCPVFIPELRQVVWPPKFKPNVPVEYDGKTNPVEFLHVYITAMHASGADDTAMANRFPLALKPNVRSWLMNLLAESVRS